MPSKFNPFRPGSIVAPGMFAGRLQQMEMFERTLFQTKHGNPQHISVIGERGIGKSSMLTVFDWTAKGRMTLLDGTRFNFIVVNLALDTGNDFRQILKRLVNELQRVMDEIMATKKWLRDAWTFLTSIEAAGISFTREGRELQDYELMDEIVKIFERTLKGIENDFDGILVLIDEADKPSKDARIGDFVKGFTERLASRGCHKIVLGLSGLPSVIEGMRSSHASSLRNIQIIQLDRLSVAESEQAILMGIDAANKENAEKTSIQNDALKRIVEYADGYPHFIQQFSYCAFEVDKDNIIGVEDVTNSLWEENGSFHQLGQKFFDTQYFEEINSEDYRKVLRVMSESGTENVTKTELRRKCQIKETKLSAALMALKKKGIMIAVKGKKGVFKLPTRPFAAWLSLLRTIELERQGSKQSSGKP